MIEYQIGALPHTPFPASRDFPSRGNERYEGKNSESYTSGTISAFSPFGGWRHHLSPASGGTIIRAYCRDAYEERPRGVLFCPLHRGGKGTQFVRKRSENRVTRFPVEKVRRSRIGGGERSEPIRRMLIMPYDTESKSRNADFISIALRAIHNPRGQRPRQTYEPSGQGPVNPKNLSLHNPSTQPAAPAAPLFYKTCGEAATITL